jgi:Phytanoyl-CoA dioxygenase (PhyH)
VGIAPASLSAALERDGVLVAKSVLADAVIERLRTEFGGVPHQRAGARQFAPSERIAGLIQPRGVIGALAAKLAGGAARPVRLLFFDKTPQSNWAVPWHQDRTIAVNEQIDLDGYGPWSVKDGVIHVEPPVAIMQAMLTLRVFVDDCADDNGPLQVAIGSHRHGRLPGREIAGVVRRSAIFPGVGQAGDVLAMKTLGIHSSERATSPGHRRVLHVDYATAELPPPLAWALT